MCECINEERVGKEEEKKRKNRNGRKKDIHFGPGDIIQDSSNTLLKNNRSLWPRCLPVSYSRLQQSFRISVLVLSFHTFTDVSLL